MRRGAAPKYKIVMLQRLGSQKNSFSSQWLGAVNGCILLLYSGSRSRLGRRAERSCQSKFRAAADIRKASRSREPP